VLRAPPKSRRRISHAMTQRCEEAAIGGLVRSMWLGVALLRRSLGNLSSTLQSSDTVHHKFRDLSGFPNFSGSDFQWRETRQVLRIRKSVMYCDSISGLSCSHKSRRVSCLLFGSSSAFLLVPPSSCFSLQPHTYTLGLHRLVHDPD
jgi:hypothetical protein